MPSTAKRLSAILLALVIILVGGYLVWTNGHHLRSGSTTQKRVLILQAKPQEWADAMKLGFYDGLSASGKEVGEGLVVVLKSAAGDSAALANIAETANGYEVVYTLGTQASQAYFDALKNGAMVFGSVTDPVAAGFYKNDLAHPRKNLTGTQDIWPYDAQFALFRQLIPQGKVIGTLYNSSEVNSQVSMGYARDAARKNGFELKEKTISSDQEVGIAVSALIAEGVSAVYIPADNTAQSSSAVIIELCNAKNVPVFTGISGIVQNGALATVGTNYYEVGKVNGQQVAKILDGVKASSIPVGIATKGDVYLNLNAAKRLGITIPAAVLREAVEKYGSS